MKIVFVADAHLKGLEDPNQGTLARFLGRLARTRAADRPDAIVLLGDIFDFWTGFKGVVYHRYLPVLQALLKLREAGTRIIYLEGNHDFQMGDFFTATLGAEVYPDNHHMSLDGKEVFLSHGDAVAMPPTYAMWRKFLRSPVFRVIKRIVTPGLVMGVAERLSRRSRAHNAEKTLHVDRKLKDFARRRVNRGFDLVILGHSHAPGVHMTGDGDRKGVYANPGSWADGGSHMVYEKGELTIEKFG